MHKLLCLILLACVPNLAFAAKDVKVTINGMVCAFCAQGLTKKFSASPAVEKVNVNLSSKTVELKVREGKSISDDEIKKAVEDSGFGMVKIEGNK